MYNNWKLFKLENTYHSELISMCGEVVSENEFKDYINKNGEIQKIDRELIIEILSDGCAAGEYLNLELDDLRKIYHLNEIINGIENDEMIPYPIFERFNGELSCLDGRHRLLICLKMQIVPSVIIIDMIPANNDKKEDIKKIREENFKEERI